MSGEVFDLAIIADGGFSTLRSKYFDADRQPEYSGYQIFWGRADYVLPQQVNRCAYLQALVNNSKEVENVGYVVDEA